MNEFLNNCHSDPAYKSCVGRIMSFAPIVILNEAQRSEEPPSTNTGVCTRRFLAMLGMTAVIYLLSVANSFGQSKTISQDKKTKAVYVPVRTKSDLAVQRLQKREAMELQKRNDVVDRTIDEKPAVMRAVLSDDVVTYEKQAVQIEENVEMYRVSKTPIKLEKQPLIKEYKLEKEKQEQHLKKEEFQKPKK